MAKNTDRQHWFTNDERDEETRKLLNMMDDLNNMEDEKRGIMADYKSSLKDLRDRIKTLSRELKLGYRNETVTEDED